MITKLIYLSIPIALLFLFVFLGVVGIPIKSTIIEKEVLIQKEVK